MGALAAVLAIAAAAPAPAAKLRIRESVTALSQKERSQFVQAVLELKKTPSPYDRTLSWYDQFVAWHVDLYRCSGTDPISNDMMWGHVGPMFLPWHRQFVLMFEDALREVSGKDVAVPYWDWTDHTSPRSVFAEDFMGGDGDRRDGYAVSTGPFRKDQWRLNVHPQGTLGRHQATEHLTRNLGEPANLPPQSDVDFALAAPDYDVPPYDESVDSSLSFRSAVEGWRHGPTIGPSTVGCAPDGWVGGLPHPQRDGAHLHGFVHGWVAGNTTGVRGAPRLKSGTMNQMTSPNDPVFFLHHANIDRLWAQWQDVHGVDTYRPTGVEGDSFEHNNADDVLIPFDRVGISVTPNDVADTRKLGYVYADSPRSRRPDAPRLLRRARARARRATRRRPARRAVVGRLTPGFVCAAPVHGQRRD